MRSATYCGEIGSRNSVPTGSPNAVISLRIFLAMEYAHLLKEARDSLDTNLLIIMRVYFEKPRTTVGWKGLINDPDINESYDANKGLMRARKILRDITALGLPVGTEFLDPISPQYVADLISWGAIGARTAESQSHRELASGLSCPIGIKNGTTGALKPAIDGIKAANHSHVFFSNTKDGKVSIYKTLGNSDSHIILRGGREPNFNADAVSQTLSALTEADVNESIMIDASHGNSQKQFKKQINVVENISAQIGDGNHAIRGLMLESHLEEGNQSITENLTYGQSITDACMKWDDTHDCLKLISEAVQKRRG
jgi:3-deoxy-7-phosphoheptulonate synthase